MSPHGCKDVMQFNVDRREREETSNQKVKYSTPIPWDFSWDLPCNLCSASWCIEVGGSIVLGHDTPSHSQGERQENIKGRHSQDGRKRKRTGGSMSDCNRVDPNKNSNDRSWEQSSGQQHASDPVFLIHLSVETNRRITRNKRSQAVKDNNTCQNGSSTGCRDQARQRQTQMEKGDYDQLVSCPNCCAEDTWGLWEPKDIPMNKLPSGLWNVI